MPRNWRRNYGTTINFKETLMKIEAIWAHPEYYLRHHFLCNGIIFLFNSSILSTRTIPLFIKNERVWGIIEPCNWCEKVPKIMPRTLSLLYVEAHTFILQSLSSAFLSRSTSHFPQATPSSLHLAFPIIKFPSPEMKLPVHGLSQGRLAHAHTYSYLHTFLPAAAPSTNTRSRDHM
jgi:hypothetical protein